MFTGKKSRLARRTLYRLIFANGLRGRERDVSATGRGAVSVGVSNAIRWSSQDERSGDIAPILMTQIADRRHRAQANQVLLIA